MFLRPKASSVHRPKAVRDWNGAVVGIEPGTMRRFFLVRETDASGVSGTGVVAEGVVFSDGTCAMRWMTDTASTAVYASTADLETIHGHGGATRIDWQD